MNAMPSRSQCSSSPSEDRKRGENSFWTLTSRPPSTCWASSMRATLALDTPAIRILPSSRRSANVPTDSAQGTGGSGRWYW